MTRSQDKAQAHTKQIVGQMIGDDKLVLEGKEDVRKAEKAEEKAGDRPGDDRQRK